MVVFVGAGGKTSAMNRLARELYCFGETVILTTTTKIFPISDSNFQLFLVKDQSAAAILNLISFSKPKIIVLGQEINQAGKIVGLEMGQINELKSLCPELTILVEGDGAKRKPFKAPRDFEPLIPESATVVVPVIGIDSIGQSVCGMHFHGVENLCAITGLKIGDIFRERDAAAVLLSKTGYQKGVPKGARWIPLINKVDHPYERKKALKLVGLLKEAGVARVMIGSLGIENSPIEFF